MLEGVVTRVEGMLSQVLVRDGRTIRCALRGVVKDLRTRTANPVAVGDRVQVEAREDGTGVIGGIHSRRTKLSRPSAHRGHEQVLVANVDRLLVVTSHARPGFQPRLVDRFLIAAAKGGLEALLCVNKLDLPAPEGLEEVLEVYRRLGHRVLRTSAATGEGLDGFAEALRGVTTVLAGPSGAGKSSLLNRLQPGLALSTAEVSEATGKGRHTTTAVSLLPLVGGGFVVDSPGIRELGLWRVEPTEVASLFGELAVHVARCRFSNGCSHRQEPGCAVREAVEAGEVSPVRYASYCAIYEEAEAERVARVYAEASEAGTRRRARTGSERKGPRGRQRPGERRTGRRDVDEGLDALDGAEDSAR
ncbi:MAG: ribosome small subunit-dependent GTPase A [Planctomycetes bacterium]|nr:ribosome small subunit-dependent GTPase A [Planctomycetota bacterium]